MMNESQLKALLKMKRREGPGAAYFAAFADEFHRYQRHCLLLEREQGATPGIFARWMDAMTALRPVMAWGGLTAMVALMALGFNLRQQPGTPDSPRATPLAYVDGSAIFSDAVDLQAELLQQVELSGEPDGAKSLFVTGEVHGGYDTTLAF